MQKLYIQFVGLVSKLMDWCPINVYLLQFVDYMSTPSITIFAFINTY